jgi:Tfp pilus assembly protein PilF
LLVGGDHVAARQQLEGLRALHPAHPLVHAYLGVAYLREARVDDARAALDEAVRLDPESFTCQMAYGEFHARLGYFDRAVTAIDCALRAPTLSLEARQTAIELRRFCSERTAGLYYRRIAHPRLPRLFRRRRTDAALSTMLESRSVTR